MRPGRVRAVLIACEIASDDGLDPEQRKERGLNVGAGQASWVRFSEVAILVAGKHGRNGPESGNFTAPIEIVEPKLKFTFFDGRFHSVGDDAAGIGIGQGTKKHAIYDGENGGGGADAERQDQ